MEENNQVEQATPKKFSKAYAICAIIFGILGGWFSVYFALYGLKQQYKGPEYATERKMCYVGLALFVVWVVILCIWALK